MTNLWCETYHYKENDIVILLIKFLGDYKIFMGVLNHLFMGFHTNILSLSPLLNIDRTYF